MKSSSFVAVFTATCTCSLLHRSQAFVSPWCHTYAETKRQRHSCTASSSPRIRYTRFSLSPWSNKEIWQRHHLLMTAVADPDDSLDGISVASPSVVVDEYENQTSGEAERLADASQIREEVEGVTEGAGLGTSEQKLGIKDRGGVSKDRLAFEMLGTKEVDRLFSTLEPCDVTGFRHKPGSLLDATALIGGTTVGAGILALPASTLQAGFLPSSVGLIMMWAYMASTALLIAEVNVNVICRRGTPGVGLIALAEQALGKGGARFTGAVYVFIHYSLLVAYMAQGGGLLNDAFKSFIASGPTTALAGLPEWAGPTTFCVALASMLLFCSEEAVASINSTLVAVILASFAGLVFVGSEGIHPEYLANQDWAKVPAAIPAMYIAMVFHNVVPVVTTQLEGNVVKIRKAVLWGSLAPLVMFLVWNAVILGTVPKDAGLVAEATGGVFDPLQALRQGAGVSGTMGTVLGPLISVFSEVAIVTSFIGFVVGLLDFFTDVLNISPGDTSKELPLYGLILIPPLAVAITDPDIFFAALDNAGTFGISLLCGLLPSAMAWSQRYGSSDGEDGAELSLATLPLVPGGKATLAGIAGFALVVIFQKLLEMSGISI